MSRRPVPSLTVGFLLLFCAGFALVSLDRPQRNWDMIGYVVPARAFECHDPWVLQKEVCELLSRSVPRESVLEVTGRYFRRTVATDAESLRQHLPLCGIRLVYMDPVLAPWKLGLNPFFATDSISAGCAAA